MARQRIDVGVIFKDQPFAEDPRMAAVYYAAVGRLLMLWGRLERHVDTLLLLAASLPEAASLRERMPDAVPVSMKLKAATWRRAFAGIERLAPWRDEAETLISDILTAHGDRVAVVHSSWQGFVSEDPLTVEMTHHKHGRDRIHRSTYRVTLPDLIQMQSNAHTLNKRLLPVARALVDLRLASQAPGKP
jgi:hypothetical protein